MSDRKVHTVVGGVAGGIGYLILRDIDFEELDFLDLVAASVGGILGGIVPDFIDPPNNPNHRAFAHSWIGGGGSNVAIFEWINSLNLHPTFKWFLRGLILGYLSHLILDSTTPKGLPII